jgi:hypothetical protein
MTEPPQTAPPTSRKRTRGRLTQTPLGEPASDAIVGLSRAGWPAACAHEPTSAGATPVNSQRW